MSNLSSARKTINHTLKHHSEWDYEVRRPCLHYHDGKCDLGHNWKCITDGTICGDYE